MDPGRPKNQSSQNQMKPAPLCRARRADSDHIFFFENGHRMQKLSRSEVQVKHGKKSQSQSQSQWSKSTMTSVVHHDDVSMTHGSTRG
jgi:hypothetical protein